MIVISGAFVQSFDIAATPTDSSGFVGVASQSNGSSASSGTAHQIQILRLDKFSLFLRQRELEIQLPPPCSELFCCISKPQKDTGLLKVALSALRLSTLPHLSYGLESASCNRVAGSKEDIINILIYSHETTLANLPIPDTPLANAKGADLQPF